MRVGAAGVLVGLVAFFAVYFHFARKIDQALGEGNVQIGTMIFSAPRTVYRGDPLNVQDVIEYLEHCGYRADSKSRTGQYTRTPDGLEVITGPQSYFEPHVVRLHFKAGRLVRIHSRSDGQDHEYLQLEPELITNLAKGDREKRRPVNFADLPEHLIDALVSTEDKRFFDHRGLDLLRVGKAAYVDIKERSKEQGASTITMQLARSFWLDPEKTFRRKLAEVIMTAELERRFSKRQILELYANEVYLGRRGSFSIHGFGQAARSYFNKDARQLTLPESALLVGIIQRPAFFNPFKHPARAKARRDLVLTLMANNGRLNPQQLAAATSAPITLSPGETETSDAPYFVDLVHNSIDDVLGDSEVDQDNSYHVYTSLDLRLQREAVAAVRDAMKEVDRNIRAKRGRKKTGPLPQVALVALDPDTGAVRALVGGREYGQSQLNRALAKRQPGSAFKPFVFAAAINTGIDRKRDIITAASSVLDEPTVFRYAKQKYEPGNFGGSFHGQVTLRTALRKSLNIPTVKFAEMVGYGEVAQLAKAAGMNDGLQPTPALALGAYEVTPLEIAGAYTIFSAGGLYHRASVIDSARDRLNRIVYSNREQPRRVLDPRVAYILTNMMEDVIRAGTAAGVRARGFDAPAAGKTGTSRDGWFAGYTSNLLAVVWVGYDDNTELEVEGAKSALPVWTEFMKRAHALPQYRKPGPFKAPRGITRIDIDGDSGARAGEHCENVRTEVFLEGTGPKSDCDLHSGEFVFTENDSEEQTRARRGIVGRVLGIFR